MVTPNDMKHGRLLVQRNLMTQEDVARCLNELKQHGGSKSLLDLVVEKGVLPADMAEVLQAAPSPVDPIQEDRDLAQRVVQCGLATQSQVSECFAIIEDLQRKGVTNVLRLGQLLLSKGYVTEDELNQILVASTISPVLSAPAPPPAFAPSPAAAVSAPSIDFGSLDVDADQDLLPRVSRPPTPRLAPSPSPAGALAPPPARNTPVQGTPKLAGGPRGTPALGSPGLAPAGGGIGLGLPRGTPALGSPGLAAAPRGSTPPQGVLRPAPPRTTPPQGSPGVAPASRKTPAQGTPGLGGAGAGAPLLAPTRGGLYGSARCAFCALDIREGIPRQMCGHCADCYHVECWKKSDGCVKEACRQMLYVTSGQAHRILGNAGAGSPSDLIGRFAPAAIKLGGLAVLVVLLVFGYLAFARDAQYYYDAGREKRKEMATTGGEEKRVLRPWDLDRGMQAAKGISNVERQINLDEQIACFKMAVQKKPGFIEAWFELGRAYLESDKNKESFEALQKVLELQPTNVEAMLTIGVSAERLEDLEGAEKYYKRALETRPDLEDANRKLADLYDLKCPDRQEDAAAQFRIILAKKPEDAEIAGRLARILIGQKKYDEAMLVLEKAEKLAPDSPQLKQKRAQIYFARGEWDKALGYAEQVFAADPAAWDALKIKATCLFKLNRLEEALHDAKEVVGGRPDVEIYSLAGYLSLLRGDPTTGVSYLQQAFALGRQQSLDTGKLSALLNDVGDALFKLGRAEEAKTAFEQLRSMNSGFPRINFKVGLAAVAVKDRGAAMSAVKDLLQRAPKDPDVRALEGRLLREGGDVEAALTALKGIFAEGAKSSYAYVELGLTHLKKQNTAEALGAFRAALALDQNPEALFELAMAYSRLKKDDVAQEFLRQYVEKVTFGTRFELARSFLEKGGVPRAKDEFTYVFDLCREPARRLAAGSAATPRHLEAVYAGLQGLVTFSAVLAGDVTAAQAGAAGFASAIATLDQPPQAFSNPDPATAKAQLEAEYMRFAELWYGSLTSATNLLADFIRKMDRDRRCSDAVEKLLADFKQATDNTSTVEGRFANSAQTFASTLSLVLRLLADSEVTRQQREQLDEARRFQRESCTNSLQIACGELYSSVRFAALLVTALDRKKVYRDQVFSIDRRFEQREMKAKTVLEQLKNASSTLSELLYIVVSDPSLKP
ncbi:MAG: tetratricopeptide repeat protein [Planctomycetes bacterium]|nr:tetratricopeptide repeat protein [Planctomycetota bacterium]